MKPKLLPLPILMAVISVGALIVSILLRVLDPSWRWYQEPLHAAMEAVGGLAAIAMSVALLERPDASVARLFPVACGFLAMGLLEMFHAVAAPGDGFIVLRSMASLAGGIGFALVWVSAAEERIRSPRRLVWGVALAAGTFGIWTLQFPQHVPVMFRDDRFTPTALGLQSFACALFLASALRFASDYRRSGDGEDALFASLAFLFALAEAMFLYSIVWDARWWFWHAIRLLAYLLVLGSMVRAYRRMLFDLESSLVLTQQAEEAARSSELRLREALDIRERLAQDLHDGIIQSLFALGLNLERCQRLITSAPQEVAAQLAQSVHSLQTVIRDLRGYIAGREMEDSGDGDLTAALTLLARTMESTAELPCRLDIDPIVAGEMTPEQARHIVHIAREALSNSVRHARARHEVISLQRHQKGFRLIIQDNGEGFDPNNVNGRGEGLKNMAARAGKLGAHFQIHSVPGEGTTLLFDIPRS